MSAEGHLRSFVERVERIEEEIKTLNDDKSEVYKEIRSAGFDVKTVRKVVAKRKIEDHVRDEQDALFDTYWNALHGSGLVHVHTRENIEEFDAETGEFLNDESSHSDERVTDRKAAEDRVGANAGGDNVESSAERADQERTEPSGPEAERATNSLETAHEPMGGTGDDCSFVNRGVWPPQGGASSSRGNDSLSVVTVVGTESGTVPSFIAKAYTRRPHCLNRAGCGSYTEEHCHPCTKAMREQEELA